MQSLQGRIKDGAQAMRGLIQDQVFDHNDSGKLTYLGSYSPDAMNYIVHSLSVALPEYLPPLSLVTISIYRRKRFPVFWLSEMMREINIGDPSSQQSAADNLQAPINPHLTFESLLMLASIPETQYTNFQRVQQVFQQKLGELLLSPFQEIRNLAIYAAGNKIIGREQEIIKLVEDDCKQLWVLVNHIYEGKIPIVRIFPYMLQYEPMAYRMASELSNFPAHPVISSVLKDEALLQNVVESLDYFDPEVIDFGLTLIGNMVAESEIVATTLLIKQLLANLVKFLEDPDMFLKTVWIYCNLSSYNCAIPHIMAQIPVITAIVGTIKNSSASERLREQCCNVIANIISNGQFKSAFQLWCHASLVQTFEMSLSSHSTTFLIAQLKLIGATLQLGDVFGDDSIKNSIQVLRRQLTELTYNQNQQISKVASKVEQLLGEQQDW